VTNMWVLCLNNIFFLFITRKWGQIGYVFY
jgi:hypothetical protein